MVLWCRSRRHMLRGRLGVRFLVLTIRIRLEERYRRAGFMVYVLHEFSSFIL